MILTRCNQSKTLCVISRFAKTFGHILFRLFCHQLMFMLFCHQLDNIHVKGNFILCALMIESVIFLSQNVTIVLLFDPSFCLLEKTKKLSFVFRSSS